MAGLVPAIPLSLAWHCPINRDGRDKSGHDTVEQPLAAIYLYWYHRATLKFASPTKWPTNREKSNKLKARLPRGLQDRTPGEIAATRAMIEKIRAVYELYGFEPVETPAFEYTEALGKFLPDQDRPNEGVFSFLDDDEQWLSLRYDLTAPLARYVAENFDTLPKPYRSYRVGYVYRNEKPGPGRFRQFMQFDADTVGSGSPAADAEMCMMAADAIEALGIPRGSYIVKVNNRKVLDGVLDCIGLGGENNAGKRLTVLRAIDKYDRLGRDGVAALLGEGRKDESGDFTRGAGLDAKQSESVLRYIETPLSDRGSDVESALDNWGKVIELSSTGKAGIAELKQIGVLVRAAELRRRPHQLRHQRGARPGILHRPCFRGGTDLRRPTARTARRASARSAAAAAMMGSSRAFAASRYRRPDFPSACRACSPRSNISARSKPRPSSARSSSPSSTRNGSPIIRTWWRRCAAPASAPSFISAPANSPRR